jgi:hypothetical protein
MSNPGNLNLLTGKKLKRISVVELREDPNPAGGAGRFGRRISFLRDQISWLGKTLQGLASEGRGCIGD